MSRTTQDLMKMAVDLGNAIRKPADVEAIVIVFDPSTGCAGWGATVVGPEALSVVSDVLDDIICQSGGVL